jgi:hypothetical protein
MGTFSFNGYDGSNYSTELRKTHGNFSSFGIVQGGSDGEDAGKFWFTLDSVHRSVVGVYIDLTESSRRKGVATAILKFMGATVPTEWTIRVQAMENANLRRLWEEVAHNKSLLIARLQDRDSGLFISRAATTADLVVVDVDMNGVSPTIVLRHAVTEHTQ